MRPGNGSRPSEAGMVVKAEDVELMHRLYERFGFVLVADPTNPAEFVILSPEGVDSATVLLRVVRRVIEGEGIE